MISRLQSSMALPSLTPAPAPAPATAPAPAPAQIIGRDWGAKPDEDFGAILSRLASQTVDTIRDGESAAMGGIRGTVPVQDVVDKVMAAEQALQTGLALRDKIVGAYLEISRMTI